MRTERALLIQADQELQAGLRAHGMEIVSVPDGPAALAAFQRLETSFDAVVLVLQSAERIDSTLIAELGKIGQQLPLLILAPSENKEAHIRSLELGADDYLAMPCDADVLAARIRAVIRRDEHLPVYMVRGMEVDVGRRKLRHKNEHIELTPREFDVLRVLLEADGRVVSKQKLLERVWDIHSPPGTTVVEVQIARIRGKLKNVSPDLIQTVVGEGYCLQS